VTDLRGSPDVEVAALTDALLSADLRQQLVIGECPYRRPGIGPSNAI